IDQTVNIESIESTKAIRSKKKIYGVIAIKKAANNPTRLLKKTRPKRKMPIKVPKPEATARSRPANKGSATILKTGIMLHINKGVLPSDKGKNLKVGSAFIT